MNGTPTSVGTETWKLEDPQQFRWSSVIDKTVPYPHREQVRVEGIPRKWQIRSIEVRSVSADREDTFEGKVKNDAFLVSVKRSKIDEKYSLPVSASTEYDYLSLAFNIITFHRLRLRRGESIEIDVAYIFPVSDEETFNTRMVRQRYQRLADDSISVPAGRYSTAKHYVYRNLDSGWTGNIWTDNLETVLRYEKLCELVSYHIG